MGGLPELFDLVFYICIDIFIFCWAWRLRIEVAKLSAYAPTFAGSFGLCFEAAAYWSIAAVLRMLRPKAFGIVGSSNSTGIVSERILGLADRWYSAEEEAESLWDCRHQRFSLWRERADTRSG